MCPHKPSEEPVVFSFIHIAIHSFIHLSTHPSIQQTLKNLLHDVPKPAMGPLLLDTIHKPSQEAG